MGPHKRHTQAGHTPLIFDLLLSSSVSLFAPFQPHARQRARRVFLKKHVPSPLSVTLSPLAPVTWEDFRFFPF